MDPMGIGLFHKLISHELRTPVFLPANQFMERNKGFFCFVAQLGMYFLDGFVWAPRKLSKLHTVYGSFIVPESQQELQVKKTDRNCPKKERSTNHQIWANFITTFPAEVTLP